jgi:GTPase SAR1 family protein
MIEMEILNDHEQTPKFKFIVLGMEGSGKTSFLHRVDHQSFSL